jgi:serine/threonine protein kinase
MSGSGSAAFFAFGGPFQVILESLNPCIPDFTPSSSDVEIGRHVRIGRNDLILSDPYISGSHARINFLMPGDLLRRDNGIIATLTDLSTNGTFVCDKKASLGTSVDRRVGRGLTVHLREGSIVTLSRVAKADRALVPPSLGMIAFSVRTTLARVDDRAQFRPSASSQTQPHAYEAPGNGHAAMWSDGDSFMQSVTAFTSDPKALRRTGRLWGDYCRIGDLGSGAYAKVHLVASHVTGERFAAKEILRTMKLDPFAKPSTAADAPWHPIGPGYGRSARGGSYDNVEDEVAALSRCAHPNVIRFVDRYVENGHIWLILELANAGELFDKVCNYTCFSEDHARPLFRSLLEGVTHMHSVGVAHRDIKPENIFLHKYVYTPSQEEARALGTEDERSRPHVRYVPKLGDFGMAFVDRSGGGARAASSLTARANCPALAADPASRAPHPHADEKSGITRCYSVAGTKHYLAPEVSFALNQDKALALLRLDRSSRQLDEEDPLKSSPPTFGSLWLLGFGPIWEGDLPTPTGAFGRSDMPLKDHRLDAMGEQNRIFVTAAAVTWSTLASPTRSSLLAACEWRKRALASYRQLRPDFAKHAIWVGDKLGYSGWAVSSEILSSVTEALSVDRALKWIPEPPLSGDTSNTLIQSAQSLVNLDSSAHNGYDPFKADAYALGALLYVLLSGQHLCPEEERLWERSATRSIDFSSKVWTSISIEAKLLILGLLHPDPSQRLGALAATKHPWVFGARLAEREVDTTPALRYVWELPYSMPPPEPLLVKASSSQVAKSKDSFRSPAPRTATSFAGRVPQHASAATPRYAAVDEDADTQAIGRSHGKKSSKRPRKVSPEQAKPSSSSDGGRRLSNIALCPPVADDELSQVAMENSLLELPASQRR